MHKKLFIPGPTEVRDDILAAQAQPLIGHRMKAMTELYTGLINKTKEILATREHIPNKKERRKIRQEKAKRKGKNE